MDVDRVAWQGRAVAVGVDPIGVDAPFLAAAGPRGPEVAALAAELRAPPSGLWASTRQRQGNPRRLLA